MKKTGIFIICYFQLLVLAFGQTEVISKPYFPDVIQSIAGDNSTYHYIENAALVNVPGGQTFDESAISAVPLTDSRLDSSYHVLSLHTGNFVAADQLAGKNYEVVLDYKLIYYQMSGGSIDSTDLLRMRIDYNELANTKYRAKDYHLLRDVGYVRLKIESFQLRDRNTDQVLNDMTGYTSLFELRQTLTTYTTSRPVPAETPQFVEVNQTTNGAYLQLFWRAVSWAGSYDVEWTYIDDYPAGPADPPLTKAELSFDFQENSTRINTRGQEYHIPLIFDRGYVVARVRAVGSWGTPAQRIEGVWSLPDRALLNTVPTEFNGFANTIALFRIEEGIVHEGGAMNWQHMATFAEEGKRKDIVRYMDGSLRNRQTSTQINTDDNLVTSETIYDHQGRPAIQVLPTPHRPANLPMSSTPGNAALSTQAVFRFVPDFNLNPSAQAYSRTDFDLGGFQCSPTGLIAAPLSSSSGAGQYYSTQNPEKDAENAYIPDAEGYPFVHTEYTPDRTGRISRTGNAGPTHQLDGGREHKYYYTSPSQPELDRIFGLDAGFAENYKKEVVIDANGQVNLTYKDGRGNVVATALAGDAPEMLAEVPEAAAASKTITIDLLAGLNRREAGSNDLVSNKTIFIAGEGDAEVTVDISYELTEDTFSPEDCPDLCYDCAYDLSLRIINDCGEVMFDQRETLDMPGFSCTGAGYSLNTTLMLPPGEYQLVKNLRVNESALEEAVADFLTQPCIADSLLKFIEQEPIPPGCFEPCIPCTDTTLVFGTVNVNSKKGSTYQIDLEFRGTAASADPNCTKFCPEENPNRLESIYEMMLGDVSPGGQYGLFYDTSLSRIHVDTFPLSVFNDDNRLPLADAHWRNPLGSYRHEDGTLSYVEIPLDPAGQPDATFYNPAATLVYIDGKAHVAPEHIERIADFLDNWHPSWAQALIYYHPEYFFYDVAQGLNSSYEIDQRLDTIETYADALASGDGRIISLTNADYTDDFNDDLGLTYVDPLFVIHPEARTLYENIAAKFIQVGDFFGISTPASRDYSILEVPVMSARCSNPIFNEAQLNSCLSGKTIYNYGETRDFEWQTYKNIALSLKDRARCEIINAQRQDADAFDFRIGTSLFEGLLPRINPYAEKEKRFACNRDFENFHPDENGDPTFNTSYDFYNYFQELRYRECGLCPAAYDVQNLLNALLSEGKLLQDVELPLGPIALSKEMVDNFEAEGDPFYWTPTILDPQTLQVDILVESQPQQFSTACSFTLYLEAPYDWNKTKLSFIHCLQPKSTFEMYMVGYTADQEAVQMALVSSCTYFDEFCTLPKSCRSTAYTDDLLMLFRFLFEKDSLQATHLLYQQSANFAKPYFGLDLENYAVKVENADEVYWQYLGIDPTQACKQDFRFVFRPVSGPDTYCNFSIYCSEISGISDDFKVLNIEPEITSGDPPSYPTAFILVLETPDGRKYRVRVTQSTECFEVFDCKLPPPNSIGELACCIPIQPFVDPVDNCEMDRIAMAEDNAERRFERFKRDVEAEFRKNYTDHCLATLENFSAVYTEKIYQHTLYYYDQAGNLLQTVPPKGVVQLADATLASVNAARLSPTPADDVYYNDHDLPSTYTYNSLNEVIRQTSPDGGTTNFTYDELGRILVSQDAALAATDRIRYIRYDALGRIIEGGVTSAPPVVLPSKMSYDDFETAYLSGIRTEVFRSVYDEALPGTEAWFKGEARRLRNRVATVLYQDTFNLSHYDHAFHYQYDMLGNKKMLVIDYAKLAREFGGDSGCLNEDILFDNVTLADGTYQTNTRITTANTVEVPTGGEVVFQAGERITLRPGFSARGNFSALIAPCEAGSTGTLLAQHLKTVEYNHDLFSGKVNRVTYQRGREDQLIHYYEYDADNRLTNVSTSTFGYEPQELRDQDAVYKYYKHGPLARTEIGEEWVHGRDYAYTIQGWLRGVNSASLEPFRDIGKDGVAGLNDLFAQDAYGFELGYFQGDYAPIGSIGSSDLFYTQTGSTPLNSNASPYPALYNGTIRYTVNANMGFENEQMQLHAYRYDQLYRLSRSQLLQQFNTSVNGWNDPDMNSRAFESNYTYDANGNLTALQRYDGNAALLDDLTYRYAQPTLHNRLQRVEDAVTTAYGSDLENQSGSNYTYDAKGRLTRDVAENISALNWFANDRLQEVVKDGVSTTFAYDAHGRRIWKQTPDKSTYTVRDDIGKILATYSTTNDTTRWTYSPIYGAGRLGVFTPNKVMGEAEEADTTYQLRGDKQYELTNHLGNVHTLISDRKVPDAVSGAFQADLLNAADVYPFGMPMPERQINRQSYAFGFQGMEKDDELKGQGNAYHTEFREYDPRVGRWLSVDAMQDSFPSLSPYNFVENNPISLVDPDGLTPTENKIPKIVSHSIAFREELSRIRTTNEQVQSYADRGLNLADRLLQEVERNHSLTDAERGRIESLRRGVNRARREVNTNYLRISEVHQNVLRALEIIIQSEAIGDLSDPEMTLEERMENARRFDRLLENAGGVAESTGIFYLSQIGEFLKELGERGFIAHTTEDLLSHATYIEENVIPETSGIQRGLTPPGGNVQPAEGN